MLPVLSLVVPVFAQSGNSLNTFDRQFLYRAAQTNMTEAHIGQMAQQNGATQAVRDFGQSLAKDHQDQSHKLSGVAQKVRYSLPKAIDSQHQTKINQL